MEKRNLKPYVGIILVVLYFIDVFFIGTVLGAKFGLLGTFIQELLMLLMAVGVVFLFRGDLKRVFPIHKPTANGVFGTLILWLGTFLATMLITMIMAYFFPKQVLGVSQGLGDSFVSISFLFSFLVVSITPAICEEAAFRGALLSCFRGFRSKWTVIILVSVIFGAFHGSIWRFVPTFLLGIGMGYLMLETENILYSMLFHMVNNAVPVIMLFVMNKVYDVMGMSDALDTQMAQVTQLPLSSVASYIMYGGAAPILIYIGNYLIHRGQPGYDRGVFPREKRNLMIGLVATAIGCMFLGMLLFAVSIVVDAGLYEQISQMI